MRRFLTGLLWAAVSLLLLAGLDQLLVRVPVTSPMPLAVVTFYRDLRSRVLEMVTELASVQAPSAKPAKTTPSAPGKGEPPASIEGLIEQHQTKSAAPRPPSPAVPARLKSSIQTQDPAPRYVYADEGGELHFAATLAEIPEQFRERAKALGE